MRPDKISVYDLFDRQRRYTVPLYQRQYVWTQEVQWLPLWEDISDKARLVQLGEAKAPHFLGAIVTSQRQVYGNELSAWEVIDGQQRLTTLQLVLAAFRDVLAAKGEHRFDRDLARITKNEGAMKDPVERFKVWPTNSDRAAFVNVVEAGSLAEVLQRYPGLRGRPKRPVSPLAGAYAYFYRAIEGYLDSADVDGANSVSARIDALFETFRRYLLIVNIELEVGDDPQVIFESLNGRGVPLLPSDLIRNFVFMRAGAGHANLDELYRQYWRPYDELMFGASRDGGPWWKQTERQGRLRRPRLDLFLFHYVQFRRDAEANIGHLFQEFRDWWNDATTQVPASQALADLMRYGDAFREWVDPDESSRLSVFARRLKALDTATAYPLMFFLFVDQHGRLSPQEAEGIVEDLESYLVRRAVCGLTNKQYNRFFIGLLRRLRAVPLTRERFRAELAFAKGDSVRWPTDEEFGRAFVHRPAYQSLRPEMVGMVLGALERRLMTNKHEQVRVDGKLSIEHVMPQDWERRWSLPDKSDETIALRERLLHTFGNLTLVTPAFNTALSNREFDRKQKEFRRVSRLLLNKYFEDEELTEWHETAIVTRGKTLFDLARQLWTHPESAEGASHLNLDALPERAWTTSVEDQPVPDEPPIDLAGATNLLDAVAALLARRSQPPTA